MTESHIRQKLHFWTLNGINGSTANPGQAPNNLCYVYLVTEFDGITDSVTKI